MQSSVAPKLLLLALPLLLIFGPVLQLQARELGALNYYVHAARGVCLFLLLMPSDN